MQEVKSTEELQPGRLINIERYQWSADSELRWEVRDNGSICNGAELLNWFTTEEQAQEWARSYVDRQRAAGKDARLTQWEGYLHRHFDVYPFNLRHDMILKIVKMLDASYDSLVMKDHGRILREAHKLLPSLLNLPPCCSGCDIEAGQRTITACVQGLDVGHADYHETIVYYCDPCLRGAERASRIREYKVKVVRIGKPAFTEYPLIGVAK